MGNFLKDLTKPFKSFGKGISNLPTGDFKDAGKYLGKVPEEMYKVSPTYYGLSLIDDYMRPEMPQPIPDVVPDPAATPDSGGNPLDSLKKRRKTSGRADTVQAGSLVPSSVGYKTLLG